MKKGNYCGYQSINTYHEMRKKLKIIFFADIVAEHTLRWVTYFAKIGHEVRIISWNDLSCGYRLDDVKNSFHPTRLHIVSDRRPVNKFAYIVWIASLIRKIRRIFLNIQPDIIHSHSVGSYAWVTLFLLSTTSVMTPWGTDVLIDMKESAINRFLSL